jgi:hypothetical protein
LFKWNSKNIREGSNVLTKSNSFNTNLLIRFENNWNNSNLNYILWMTWWIQYTLYGLDWSKTIKKEINWSSNIKIKYWWLYVGWNYSNSVRWLYEINRKNGCRSSITTVHNLKIKTYNKIVQNSSKLIRWIKVNKKNSLFDIS